MLSERKGLLVGVVLDLSLSMSMTIKNSDSGQSSRIEAYAKVFRQALEDYGAVLDFAEPEQRGTLRLFIQGFGFASEQGGGESGWRSSIGDVLSVLTRGEQAAERYLPLQTELETLWLEEVKNLIRKTRIRGNAEQELKDALREELEKGRPDKRESTVGRFGGLWWEKWREEIRQKVVEHIKETQADTVVLLTRDAFDQHSEEIMQVIQAGMIRFIDEEAFKMLHLYDEGSSSEQRRAAFDRRALRKIYDDVSNQVLEIMKAHIGSIWQKSNATTFLMRAASILRIEPDYKRLKNATEQCARQVIWEIVKPRVDNAARRLARERFRRAVLVACAQKVKDQETTLSLQEIRELIGQETHVAREELPIFGVSPLGFALAQTYERLREEMQQPQNEELRPLIVLISDGMPTDSDEMPSLVLAERIKQVRIPIICGFIMDENIGSPRILRGAWGWRWSKALYVLAVFLITIVRGLGAKLEAIEKRYMLEERRRAAAPRRLISAFVEVGGFLLALFSGAFWRAAWRGLRTFGRSARAFVHRRGGSATRARAKRWQGSRLVWPGEIAELGKRLQAANLLYALASSVDDWPDIAAQFRHGYRVEPHARFFFQVNHTDNLRDLIEGVLQPLAEEQRSMENEGAR